MEAGTSGADVSVSVRVQDCLLPELNGLLFPWGGNLEELPLSELQMREREYAWRFQEPAPRLRAHGMRRLSGVSRSGSAVNCVTHNVRLI